MPGEMFGTPIGQQNAIESQLGLAKLGMAPDVARATKATADMKEYQAEAQKRFASMMQTSQNQSLWGAAENALKAGLPDAYKYANAASNMEYRRAATRTKELEGIEKGVKAQTAVFDLKARSLTGVSNLAGLQSAFQDIEQQTGQKSGYLDDRGNLLPGITDADVPTIVGRERAKALSAKDQLTLDLNNRRLSSADEERKSKQGARDFWQNMDNQYERESARQRARAERGGSSGLFPSNVQISIGADYLSNKFNSDPKDPWSRVMGRELIDAAKRLKNNNSALTAGEALDEAFKELDKQGMFGAHRLADKKADLMRPMALPYKDGKPDSDSLKAGQLYKDDSGVTREWTGKGWSTPTKPISRGAAVTEEQARTALGGGGDDEEDDTVDDDDGED